MKRKVSKIGPATLMVSLPSKWVKRYGINKGDEMEVMEEGNSLIINTDKGVEKNDTYILDIKSSDDLLRRFLYSPYWHGYNAIRINFEDESVFEKIKSISETLFGFEIVDHGVNHCIIKNIAKGVESEFDAILNRLFLLTINMLKETYSVLDKKEFNKIKSIVPMETTTNKLSVFCRRMLNTRGHKRTSDANSIYFIVGVLESIADDCRILCEHISNKNTALSTKAKDFFKGAISQVELSYKLFSKYDKDKVIESKNMRIALEKDVSVNLPKLAKDEIYLSSALLNISRKASHIIEELY